MNADKLKELLAEAEGGEKDALHALGICRGYQEAMRDALAELEAERPTVERGPHKRVETAAKKPKPEKR